MMLLAEKCVRLFAVFCQALGQSLRQVGRKEVTAAAACWKETDFFLVRETKMKFF